MGMGSCCKVYSEPNGKQQYLQRCFFRTKVNKQRTPRNTYSTNHNRLVSHNAAQRWSLSFKNSYADWAPSDRQIWWSKDAAVMFLECILWLTARYQVAWSPFVIVPCNYVFTWRLWTAAVAIGSTLLWKPFDTFVLHHVILLSSPPLPPFFLFTLIYLFAHLFIYFHDFLISELPHIAGIKKGTCTFIIFQFRASRLTLQDPLMPQWGDRYLHFD